MKHRKRKFNPFNLLIKLLIIFYLLIGTTTCLFIYSHHLLELSDSSLNGGESIEIKQNKIPSDVLALMPSEEKVLGIKTVPSKAIGIKTLSKIEVPILMYHYIEEPSLTDRTRASLTTSPETLEAEIITLKNAGYTFMTNRELTDVIDGKSQPPTKPILLTFDDGYRDFYNLAYPVLQKYHVKATEYIITGENFLNQPNHLTTDEVKILASSGLVEIGAHTVDHIWLSNYNYSIQLQEVLNSKNTLEDIIQQPVVSFAYPYGGFDSHTIQAVQKAGFTSAVSTIPGVSQTQYNKYFLYRLRPGGMVGNRLLYCISNVSKCYAIPK